MKKIPANHLLTMSIESLWETLAGRFILVFEDGQELETNDRHTLYSAYSWQMLQAYPNTPFKIEHHVAGLKKKITFTSSTHIELMDRIYWDIVDTYGLHTPEQRDHLTRLVYQITNHMYNDLQVRCERYVSSIDILDFVEIVTHPQVESLTELKQQTWDEIEHVYSVIRNVINDVAYRHNALARAAQYQIINTNQVLQCLGPRGRGTEVDSTIMPTPIGRSFTRGMRTLYNFAAESRSAAKSLYFSNNQVRTTEYFSRRLQLLTMSVETLHYTDCQSTRYLKWRIKPPIYEEDEKGRQIKTYLGDLHFLEGKYYLDEETQTLKILRRTDTHLNNHTLSLRSVLFCQHPDHKGVCAVCFGQLSDNVMPKANLGHVCGATMTRQITQSILSLRHFLGNTRANPIMLTQQLSEYFVVSKSGFGYIMHPKWKNTGIKLMVLQDDAYGLTDVNLINNLDDANPSRMSQVQSVAFALPRSEIQPSVMVSQKKLHPMLSLEFLKYIKVHGWESDDKHFIFDLKRWDFSKPILRLPEMEYSFLENSNQIAGIIESRMKHISDRVKPESPVYTLVELFDLVNSKLKVNIALMEVIIYALMVKNGMERDYGMARNSPHAGLGVADVIMKGRSLSAAYALDDQSELMQNPSTYFKENRPDSILDVFVDPAGVMAHYKE